jgi:hypothetical protein
VQFFDSSGCLMPLRKSSQKAPIDDRSNRTKYARLHFGATFVSFVQLRVHTLLSWEPVSEAVRNTVVYLAAISLAPPQSHHIFFWLVGSAVSSSDDIKSNARITNEVYAIREVMVL